MNALALQAGVFQMFYNGVKGARIVRVPWDADIEGNYHTKVEWDIVLSLLEKDKIRKEEKERGFDATVGNTDDEGLDAPESKDNDAWLPQVEETLKTKAEKKIRDRPVDLSKKVSTRLYAERMLASIL